MAAALWAWTSVGEPPLETPPHEDPRAAPSRDDGPSQVTGAGVRNIDVRTSTTTEARDTPREIAVVDLQEAKRQSADMGEVLARSRGVAVRRSGGLGTRADVAIHGLSGDRVRVYADGVPIRFAGLGSGLASVPLNLVDRVELYRGVVPSRLGADALGGAIDVVTREIAPGTHGSAAYQLGSFATHRVAATVGHRLDDIGLFALASGFFDTTDNEYPIDVEVPDATGQVAPATVRRFHDRYLARGGSVETGVLGRRFADRLSVRAHMSAYDKDIQHNFEMSAPYGEVTSSQRTMGSLLRWSAQPWTEFGFDVAMAYAFFETDFLDVATCAYDWYGRCVFDRPQRGEIDGQPYDRTVTQHSAYGRFALSGSPATQHTITFSANPELTWRSGVDREADPGEYDPFAATRRLSTLANALEYEAELFDERVHNVVFVKDFFQLTDASRMLPSSVIGQVDVRKHAFGAGDSLRVRIVPGLWAKASYEWALRLPSPDEVFGDGVLLLENLELAPERSHNANVGLAGQWGRSNVGWFDVDATGFARYADDLVVLLANGTFAVYQNVLAARIVGVEGSASYTTPGDYFAIAANATWLDARNESREGVFADYRGDRLPNRPWLLANASARASWPNLVLAGDRLSLTASMRYVHEFFRSWESLGDQTTKMTIPTQTVWSLGLGYLTTGAKISVATSLSIENVFDQATYDYFGVQRPGRAAYGKTTINF